MGDKVPQTTVMLIKRMRRVARFLDRLAATADAGVTQIRLRAHANTCHQAAGRLDDFLIAEIGETR